MDLWIYLEWAYLTWKPFLLFPKSIICLLIPWNIGTLLKNSVIEWMEDQKDLLSRARVKGEKRQHKLKHLYIQLCKYPKEIFDVIG